MSACTCCCSVSPIALVLRGSLTQYCWLRGAHPQLRRAYYQIVPSHSLAQGHRGLGERRRRHSGETRAGVAEFFADHTVVAGGC